MRIIIFGTTGMVGAGVLREAMATINQSILAKAFRGELVSQDPNDEPASVLLERIRAEREANGVKGNKTKSGQAPREAR